MKKLINLLDVDEWMDIHYWFYFSYKIINMKINQFNFLIHYCNFYHFSVIIGVNFWKLDFNSFLKFAVEFCLFKSIFF